MATAEKKKLSARESKKAKAIERATNTNQLQIAQHERVWPEPDVDQEDMLISIAKAGAMAGVTVSTVHMWIRNGELRSWKLGPRTTRVRYGDMKQFIESKLVEK